VEEGKSKKMDEYDQVIQWTNRINSLISKIKSHLDPIEVREVEEMKLKPSGGVLRASRDAIVTKILQKVDRSSRIHHPK